MVVSMCALIFVAFIQESVLIPQDVPLESLGDHGLVVHRDPSYYGVKLMYGESCNILSGEYSSIHEEDGMIIAEKGSNQKVILWINGEERSDSYLDFAIDNGRVYGFNTQFEKVYVGEKKDLTF